MEPGEWRSGQAGRAWSAEPADEAQSPDLWGEQPSGGWPGGAPWTPPPAAGAHSAPGPARHAAAPADSERPGTSWIGTSPGAADPGLPRWDDPRWGERGQPATPPAPRARHSSALVPVTREPRRRPEPGRDQPALSSVLTYTGAWYAIPTALFLAWMLVLDSEHRAAAWRSAVSGLGWAFAAVLASLAVAFALRTFVTGWRALTMSFAATVIGAGVMTIIHSAA